MADILTPPRMKGCVVPAALTALEWSPGVNYQIGEIVKTGPNLFIAVGNGDVNRMLWLAYAYDATVNADMSQAQLTLNDPPIDLLAITAPLADPDLLFKLARVTTSLNSPAAIGAAFAALLAGGTAAEKTALERIASISLNRAWRDSPPAAGVGTATVNFSDAGQDNNSRYYKLTANLPHTEGYTGVFPRENETYAPEDQGYWTEVTSLVPADAGTHRGNTGDCKATMPIEADWCPRCGRQVA